MIRPRYRVGVLGNAYGIYLEGRLIVGGFSYQRAIEEADKLNREASQ